MFSGCATILFIASEFWINSAAPREKRGFIFGIYATTLSLGFDAGPAILAATCSDTILPFVVGTIIIAFAALPVALAGRIVPQVESRPSRGFLAFVLVAPAAVMAAFVFGASERSMFSLMALWGERSGFPEAQAALLITAAGIGSLMAAVPIGYLADRMNCNLLLLVCALVGAAGAFALPYTIATPWMTFAVILLFGGMTAGLYTVGLTHLGARFTGADLATANAVFVTMYALGMLIGPMISGIGMDYSNPNGLL